LQQGFLFHAIYDTQGPDVYTVQLILGLEGPLRESGLRAAANKLWQRHANLRASFAHQGLNQPLQLIHSEVSLPWVTIDLSSLDPVTREEHLNQLLDQDRAQRFDLSHPPLTRFTLVRVAPDRHQLVITNHHILMDGWSGTVLINELFTVYAQNEGDAALPRVTPYRDYLGWIATQDHAAATTAWESALAGLEEPTRMAPYDPKRTPIVPEHVGVELPKALTEALTRQARSHSLTLNSVFQGAWTILLGRLSGREDVVFGTTVAGRPPEITGVESMVGLFINTLPLRARLRWTDSLIELCTQIQYNQSQLIPHHYLGLNEIQRLAGLGELFDTLLVFENYPVDQSALQKTFAGLRVASADGNDAAHYPLSLMVVPGETLRLRFEYRPDLFRRSTVEAFAGRLVRVLEAVAAHPAQPIGQIDLLAPEEREQIVVEWNQTRTEFPSEVTIDQLFEEQVRRSPNAIAIEHNGRRWTYQQLDKRANQLTHLLHNAGAEPKTFVGLCLERSPELFAGMLASLKVGGAYVPIDPTYPQERLVQMLDQVPVVITTRQYARLFQDVPIRVICVEDAAVSTAPKKEVPRLSRGDSIAYVIYTSGSTGTPKGVMVPHRGAVRLFRQSNYLQIRESDVIAQTLNPCFDASVQEIWGALLHGARLVILNKELLLSPVRFKQALEEHQITAWMTSTALFNLMANEIPEVFARLRYVSFGGEAADPQSVSKVLQHGAPEHLYNAYGPTEASVVATCLDIKQVSAGAQSIPIGKPISNTTVYLLDDCRNPVPVDVPGEIYIGGPAVAHGYVGAPVLTAERFIDDPFSSESGARLYKTGDLAKWLPDGSLEYIGRTDSQHKIRGFRIELGEIETALKQWPGARDAAVIVRTDSEKSKQLIGYIATDSSKTTAREIREFLETRLPAYMIPSAMVVLKEFPLNANGKVDRRALLEIPPVGDEPAIEMPRTPLEAGLVAIWEQALGRESVGIHDHFFEVGGDSLLAVQVASRMQEFIGRPVQAIRILETPTIARLAQLFQRENGQAGAKIEPTNGDLAPLTGESGPLPTSTLSVRSRPTLVAIQPLGSRPAFFNVHDGYGSAMYYSILANRLGSEQPFYGFVVQDDGESILRLTSIEAIATAYIEELRQVQPSGPYYLGGFCVGGVVAFEMAQQLKAAGEEVALLALFDANNPLTPLRRQSLRERLHHHVRATKDLSLPEKATTLAKLASNQIKSRFGKWQDRIQKRPAQAVSTPRNEVFGNEVQSLLDQAQNLYRPRPYSGKLTLILPHKAVPGYEILPDRGWTELAGGEIEIHHIPGEHGLIFKQPYVDGLAAKVTACLRAAEQHSSCLEPS
jgi:amino acid adenylation domain-containing protein